MVRDPLDDEKVEVEIVCPSCGYRATRTAARLRRETLVTVNYETPRNQFADTMQKAPVREPIA